MTDAPRSLAITDRRLLHPSETEAPALRAPLPSLKRWLAQCIEAGVEAIQVREKDLSDAALFAWSGQIVDVVRRSRRADLRILINGRFDIAVAVGADGVHLTSQGLPADVLRAQLDRHPPPATGRWLIGCSTHGVEDVQRAKEQGADYVVFGPLFDTPSKAGMGSPPGEDGLRLACRVGIPVLALGGIRPQDVPTARQCGAHGVAAIRGYNESAAEMCAEITRAWPEAGGGMHSS